ncbi:hypothetical protein ACQP1P_35425 [Dactylosporangium sp. CA-052675]|uniref:hypothetical protein n=1 Tax=Dactylosporangium sp. CA-052675 TaxID=3239927 RepID=UPI003D8F17D8
MLLFVAGLPLGFALTRAVPLAIVVAPVAGAAVATVAVLFMLAAGGSLVAWFVPLFLLTGFLAWWLRGQPRAPHSSWRDALLLTLPLTPPFLPILQQPLAWDAHLIWWLHAGYFARGGGFAREAIGNVALAFSHQDYPPLASAPVALIWQLLGTHDFYPAAIVTGAVTFSTTAAAVYAVRLVTASGPALVSWLAAIAVGYSAWSPMWLVPTAGFSDAMCATAFAAGAVLVLLGKDPFNRRTLPLTMLLLCAAGLMKNEGLTMVLALAVVASVKYRRNLRHLGWTWLPVATAGVWSVTARLLGANTDVLAGGGLTRLLHGDPDTVGRFPLVFKTMAGRVDWVVAYAVLAALLGLLVLRQRRRAFGLDSDLWLWAVCALYWLTLTLIYMTTPMPLRWHLITSVDRVMISIVVLACASAACWAVVAWHSPATAADPPAGDAPSADPQDPDGSEPPHGTARADIAF